jgi:hypothetical protein
VFDDGVNSATWPLSSSPMKKLAAHSMTTLFPNISVARGIFFFSCGCLSVSNACSVDADSVFRRE